MFFTRSRSLPAPGEALPGRQERLFDVPERHRVLGAPLEGPPPEGLETVFLAGGCFWGVERLLWRLPGVFTTVAGYQGGETPNPSYEEVCSGRTGHAEVVKVVFDPSVLPLRDLLRVFFEAHDPTEGMRQGNDVGTQYRSAVFTTTDEQAGVVADVVASYDAALRAAGAGPVTTEVRPAPPFYPAEAYHQQYLDRVPGGYCNLRGAGVSCPV